MSAEEQRCEQPDWHSSSPAGREAAVFVSVAPSRASDADLQWLQGLGKVRALKHRFNDKGWGVT